jgi:3-hydroxybutyryl-CoA dehydratase
MERSLSIDRIEVGQTFEKSFDMNQERVVAYARATGDNNPIHLDREAGANSIFGRRVAQGMLTAGFISGVFGTQFPGQGTIYLSQSIKFLKPVFMGDTITVRLEVLELMTAKNRIRVETTCLNQDGKKVLVGEAVVMPPPA